MSTKHTPGPWAFRHGSIVAWFEDRHIRLADIPDHDDNEQNANGEFIVRACNAHDGLLAALQRMVEVFDGPGGTDSPACVAARAAIARAEGQP
jgi:hypothetical protein